MIRVYTETSAERLILDHLEQLRKEHENRIRPLLEQLAAIRRAKDNVFPHTYILEDSDVCIDWKPGQPYVSINA